MEKHTAVSKWGRLLGWALLMVVIGLIPLAIGWGDLPDPVATHWGLGGAPNGSTPLPWVPVIGVGLVAVGLLTTSLFREKGQPTAEAFAMLGLMGGLGLALNITLVQLNSGVEVWTDAGEFSFWHLAAVLVGAVVGGALGFKVGRHWYPVRETESVEGPVVDIAIGEEVSWTGRATAKWPIFMLGGVAIIFVLMPDGGRWIAILILIVTVMFLHVEANVNNDGLRIRLGGIPVKKYPLSTIKSAQAIDLEPAAWGGWGWRIVPDRSAIVLRRGDALEVVFVNGRRFAVTVDDAVTGAALLNGLVARSVGES